MSISVTFKRGPARPGEHEKVVDQLTHPYRIGLDDGQPPFPVVAQAGCLAIDKRCAQSC